MDLKVILDSAWIGFIYFVSVPLRGNGSERFLSWVVLGFALCVVSVPLRGNGSESWFFSFLYRVTPLFPSPCGVMDLKVKGALLLGFSMMAVFPSPCGVMDLKDGFEVGKVYALGGFRPLAG